MRGQPLSYDEWVLALTEMAKGRGTYDRIGDAIPLALSENEAKLAGELLCRATPTPTLEWPILKAIWDHRLIRMNPMELWILDKSMFETETDETPRVLLSRRPDNDPYFPGQWHNPGGYVGGGESTDKACERVALKETGASLENCVLIGVGDFVNLSRDPELSLIFLCTLGDAPKLSDTLRWFPVNELPESMMEHSRAMLEQRIVPYVQIGRRYSTHQGALQALMEMATLMQPLQMPDNKKVR
ncbi:MAG: NUDIX hydrolase [bacterium]|nr:NUDIX hydrolase [bacterium]